MTQNTEDMPTVKPSDAAVAAKYEAEKRRYDRMQAVTIASSLSDCTTENLFTTADAILAYAETGQHESPGTESL